MLVALSGKMGSGKSLASKYIKDILSRRFYRDEVEIRSFATPLKKMLAAWCSIRDYRDLSSPEIKAQNVPDHVARYIRMELPHLSKDTYTFREAMQYIGTDIFRKKVPDFWISSTLCDYSSSKLIIIDDLRFKDEALRIHQLGGFSIRLEVPNYDTKSDHLSEIDLDDYKEFSQIIINDHSKGTGSLYTKLEDYVEGII